MLPQMYVALATMELEDLGVDPDKKFLCEPAKRACPYELEVGWRIVSRCCGDVVYLCNMCWAEVETYLGNRKLVCDLCHTVHESLRAAYNAVPI